MKQKYRCPKCGRQRKLTSHHIYPKRWFGNNRRQRTERFLLCRDCHDDLERLIPFQRMPIPFYTQIIATFLTMNTKCQHCGRVLQDQELPLNLPPGRDRFCGLACKVAFEQESEAPAVPVLSDEPYLWDPDSPPDTTSFGHP